MEAFERSDEFDPADPASAIRRIDLPVDEGEPLRKEIESFLRTVREEGEPEVTGTDGLRALQIAEAVLESIGADRRD